MVSELTVMATSHASADSSSEATGDLNSGQPPKQKSPTNLNFKLPIKLDRNNYNFWKIQVLAVVRAFNLEDFVLNPNKCPSKYIQSSREGSSEVVQSLNEDYLTWTKTDQLLFCWFFSTLSESVFGQVTHCTTSHDIWKTLGNLFAQQSKARALQLRHEIQNTKKGTLTIGEFILKMKTISESLAAAGQPISEEELISQILGGIGFEYDAVVVTITARQGQISLEEVQFLLMSYESRLAQHNTAMTIDFNQAQAHYSNFRGNNMRGRSRGRGRGHNRGGSRFVCQLCGKTGHVVSSCFKRFDQAFQGVSLQSMQQSQQGGNGNNQFFKGTGQFNNNSSNFQAQAHIGQFNPGPEPSYFVNNTTPAREPSSSKLCTFLVSNLCSKRFCSKSLCTCSKCSCANSVCTCCNAVKTSCIASKSELSDKAAATTVSQLPSLSPHSTFHVNKISHCNAFTSTSHGSVLHTWHSKLGHPSFPIVKQVLRQLCMPCTAPSSLNFCDVCQYGKIHQLSFNPSETRYKAPLEMIFTDVWGPSPQFSSQGFKYYVHFIDAYSRFTWIYPLALKSQVNDMFIHFQKHVELAFDRKIKCVQSDWGGEYRPLKTFLEQLGIAFRHPCPHTHQQNGTAERKHRHIVEMGLTLLAQAKLPLTFWWEAFHTAVYTINRLPTPLLGHMSPFQLLFKKSPDYKFLKVFGCACFPFLRPYNKHKFDFHSSKCLLLGYSDTHKGYKCLHPSGRVYISRNVIFNESDFPYHSLFPTPTSSSVSSQPSLPVSILSTETRSLSNSKPVSCSQSIPINNLANIPAIPFHVNLHISPVQQQFIEPAVTNPPQTQSIHPMQTRLKTVESDVNVTSPPAAPSAAVVGEALPTPPRRLQAANEDWPTDYPPSGPSDGAGH
ncbi:hypothetical protein EZV62_014039 [Acer yangbiense]|uniref:Integrase catalytic domain-containing protein n=1 Tax=Acer yangbiense TaxID=1000413 RepID=A0A5C7HT39_9ROSI|nr:hypothetical protein EZV62_014039 [Acer yangbiense]